MGRVYDLDGSVLFRPLEATLQRMHRGHFEIQTVAVGSIFRLNLDISAWEGEIIIEIDNLWG